MLVGFLSFGCSHAPDGAPDAPGTLPGASCVGNTMTNGLAGESSAVANLVAESQLIVAGTVTGTGARLDRIVWVDTSTQDLASTFVGGDVAIRFRGAAPSPGSQQLLFTTVRYYDSGAHVLELGELGRLDRATHAAFESRIPDIVAMFAASPLYKRVATADRVVSGTVHTIAAPANATREHDPQLAATTISVDHTLCGPIAGVADMRFATSLDIAWYRSPKLEVGQAAVFLLHYSDHDSAISLVPQDVLVALDPGDVQPPDQQPVIEQLLAMPP